LAVGHNTRSSGGEQHESSQRPLRGYLKCDERAHAMGNDDDVVA
jgi:hypothetical protein